MSIFVKAYQALLKGTYFSFDRIIIGAYFRLLHTPGGLVTWFQRLHPDKPLDKNQLMRFACRFGRRTHAFAQANHIPVIYPDKDSSKQDIARSYLAQFQKEEGIFLIMVTRQMATVYDSYAPQNRAHPLYRRLEAKQRLVNYYYFHILDKNWGHMTIGISPHPPFAARIILNGHEWLVQQADRQGLDYEKCDNCLTDMIDDQAFQELADTLAEGHLRRVCQHWMPRVMMGLTAEEIHQSGIERQYFFLQNEYCHNLLFHQPRHLTWLYQTLIDHTRPWLRPSNISSFFGKNRRGIRPHNIRVRLENPQYDLTVVNIWFGKNRIKLYDKGETVLRVEVTINQPTALGLKKSITHLAAYRRNMEQMITRLENTLHAADQCRLPHDILKALQAPTIINKYRVPGIALTNERLMTVLPATMELAKLPAGFTAAQVYSRVLERLKDTTYTKSQLTYDFRKLKGKEIIERIPHRQKYHFKVEGLKKAVGIMVFRDEILQPVLAHTHLTEIPGRPQKLSYRDQLYRNIQLDLEMLCIDYGLKQAA